MEPPKFGFSYITRRLAINNLKRDYDDQVYAYLKDNLLNLGYSFESHKDFLEFLLHRVTSVRVNTHLYKIVLDFDKKTLTGTIIGVISDEINIDYSSERVKITIG